MIITVRDNSGECYSYSTDKDSMCLFPGADEKPKVEAALKEALSFLEGSPKLVQLSVVK